jgi:hypothetical protein
LRGRQAGGLRREIILDELAMLHFAYQPLNVVGRTP